MERNEFMVEDNGVKNGYEELPSYFVTRPSL